MLEAIPDFGALGVVETVEGADQVAGDAADPFKRWSVVFLASAFRARFPPRHVPH